MKKPKQPKQLWAFLADKNGPKYKTAQKIIYNEEFGTWWYEDGIYELREIKGAGLTINDFYDFICYASSNKKDVDLFISGFNSCRTILAPFFKE